MNIEGSSDVLDQVQPKEPWILDTSSLKKGIDNYHYDVRISSKFSSNLKKLVTALLEQISTPPTKPVNNSRQLDAVQSSYLDMMTVLIHRVKTDLSIAEIQILEFAVIKHVLEQVRAQLDDLIISIKAKVTEYQARGDTELLAANHRLVSLQKNYDTILFRVNRQIFTQLQRAENRQLRTLRKQYLPGANHDATDMLYSPMLFTSDLSNINFLAEHYRIWSIATDDKSDDVGFNRVNRELETLLINALPKFTVATLKDEKSTSTPELYDSLGGLLQTQRFMGVPHNQKAVIQEEFCWLDDPEVVRQLFDVDRYPAILSTARAEQGLKSWWHQRGQFQKLNRVLDRVAKQLERSSVFKPLIASVHLADIWNETLAERFDARTLCQYLSSQITLKKLQERASGKKVLSEKYLTLLEKTVAEIDSQATTCSRQSAAKILEDVCRFRLHLKYYRFAHRAFNRLNILKNPEDIELSKQAETLYTLFTDGEREELDLKIAHHAVLKADVRGSTVVTEELQSRNLNPASYFSLRFFSPINKILSTYSASKVFVEGDAVILSFLEHEQEPQQWFAVARACGLAKSMLSIVHANNRYSKQMDLPPLELGIGICYLGKSPHFLYDEEKPIMISSAIGLADRLSGCSWKLRDKFNPGLFSVDIFELPEGEQDKGEKGQQVLRYNVNGILLEDAALAKLRTEINLKRATVKINNEQIVLLVGKYPDTEGKSHDLVIREGRIGIWRDNATETGARTDKPFYEVVSNRKFISEVVGKL